MKTLKTHDRLPGSGKSLLPFRSVLFILLIPCLLLPHRAYSELKETISNLVYKSNCKNKAKAEAMISKLLLSHESMSNIDINNHYKQLFQNCGSDIFYSLCLSDDTGREQKRIIIMGIVGRDESLDEREMPMAISLLMTMPDDRNGPINSPYPLFRWLIEMFASKVFSALDRDVGNHERFDNKQLHTNRKQYLLSNIDKYISLSDKPEMISKFEKYREIVLKLEPPPTPTPDWIPLPKRTAATPK